MFWISTPWLLTNKAFADKSVKGIKVKKYRVLPGLKIFTSPFHYPSWSAPLGGLYMILYTVKYVLQDSGWNYGLEYQLLNYLLLMSLNLNFIVRLV